MDEKFINNMSASFQKSVSEILQSKLEKAIIKLKSLNINFSEVSVVGGVANNNYIKKKLNEICKKYNLKLVLPKIQMMSDNAAMIAWLTLSKYDISFSDINFKPNPRMLIKNN